jgi:ribosome-binding factor A
MTSEEIKRHRMESILKEIIPQALGTLDDSRINALLVTDVVCSRGRSDAKVYLDKAFMDVQEQDEALKQLRKVVRHIQSHCKASEGWFRVPNLTFEFDEQLDHITKMEQLFAQIKQSKDSDEPRS